MHGCGLTSNSSSEKQKWPQDGGWHGDRGRPEEGGCSAALLSNWKRSKRYSHIAADASSTESWQACWMLPWVHHTLGGALSSLPDLSSLVRGVGGGGGGGGGGEEWEGGRPKQTGAVLSSTQCLKTKGKEKKGVHGTQSSLLTLYVVCMCMGIVYIKHCDKSRKLRRLCGLTSNSSSEKQKWPQDGGWHGDGGRPEEGGCSAALLSNWKRSKRYSRIAADASSTESWRACWMLPWCTTRTRSFRLYRNPWRRSIKPSGPIKPSSRHRSTL